MSLAHTLGLATAETVLAGSIIVGSLAYAANWPTSQVFGKTLIDAPDPDPTHPTIALTFDDGPSPRNTPALLDTLAAANIHATFFLIGNHVRRHPDLARRIAAAGHAIGNHTDMHPLLTRKPTARIHAELERCQRTIADTTGTLPTLFRPPYGGRRPAVLRIAHDLNLMPVLWNITAGDWASPGVPTLLRRIDKGIARNRRRARTSNVLLHDASHLDADSPHSRQNTIDTVAALLQRTDLRFVPIQAFVA